MEIVCLVVQKIHFLIQQCLQEFCMMSCMLALHNIEFLSIFVLFIFWRFSLKVFCLCHLKVSLPICPVHFPFLQLFLSPPCFFFFLSLHQSMEILSNNLSHSIFSRNFQSELCVQRLYICKRFLERRPASDQRKKVTISLLNIDTNPKKELLKAEVLLVTAQKSCLVKDNVEIALFSR